MNFSEYWLNYTKEQVTPESGGAYTDKIFLAFYDQLEERANKIMLKHGLELIYPGDLVHEFFLQLSTRVVNGVREDKILSFKDEDDFFRYAYRAMNNDALKQLKKNQSTILQGDDLDSTNLSTSIFFGELNDYEEVRKIFEAYRDSNTDCYQLIVNSYFKFNDDLELIQYYHNKGENIKADALRQKRHRCKKNFKEFYYSKIK